MDSVLWCGKQTPRPERRNGLILMQGGSKRIKISQTSVGSLIMQRAKECKAFCILIICYSSTFIPSWNPALESHVKGRKEPRIRIKHNLFHKIMSTQHCQPFVAVTNRISFSFSGVLYLRHITFYFNSAFLVFSF